MGLPYNLRVNVAVPFPALVAGANGIKVTKSFGLWTIRPDYTVYPLGVSIPSSDLPNTYSLVWNVITGVFTLIPLSAVASNKVTKTLIAAGPYTALPTDEVLIVKQTVGAAFTVNVDWSARTRPLRIVDGKGDAATNNITITPTAGQTQLATVNYSYIIDGNGGSITLTPLPDNTGAY
jgi:hypothetical protein